jgi:signal transduction histidine kinase
MKLAAHYNRTNIFITVILLIVGAIINFFAINYIARQQLDQNLAEELAEVEAYVSTNNKLPKQLDFDEDQTVFIKTGHKNMEAVFFNTTFTNLKEKETEPGRAVEGIIHLNGVNYEVIITVSRESTEYHLRFVSLMTLGLLFILLLTMFIANKYFLKGLWRPFYGLLHQIKGFDITKEQNFKLTNECVDEFVELSTAIDSMSKRVQTDYRALKHFTDNASHEMLTPLAVIMSKLDIVIQHQIPPKIFEHLQEIYTATNKLSRLNQTLLLLAKIENNVIDDSEAVEIGELLTAKIKQFQELIVGKNVQISENIYFKNIRASRYLIDILLNNLMSNAIWHNMDGGQIIVTLEENKLVFQNTGSQVRLKNSDIFERFKKGNKSEGTGLGLTLVKNICKFYDWEITYDYLDGLHTFQIVF